MSLCTSHNLVTRSQTDPAMVATSAFRAVKVSDPQLRISVDDILVFAERERLCHSARGRREAMANAQSYTHKIDDVIRSRPHTSASRYLTSVRRETMTPKSLRSEPMPSRVSSRTGDYIDDDFDDDYPINVVPSPQPICCEVIGPQACTECLKIHRRRLDRERSDARFSRVQITDHNITKATMLQRYFPTLSIEEIQMKIARGEVARPKLPHEKYDTEVTKPRRQTSEPPPKVNKFEKIRSQLFFVNIQDLNHRINSGKVSRTVGFSYTSRTVKKPFKETQDGFPAFVSPRKQLKQPQKDVNDRRSFPFDPPLLAKRNQRPEPPFFAGSSKPYKLPEKLPDKIEFVDNGLTKRSISVLSDAASELSYEGSKLDNSSESVELPNNEILNVKRSTSVMSESHIEDTITEETPQEVKEHAQTEQYPVEKAAIEMDDEYRSETNTPTPSFDDNDDDDDLFSPRLELEINQ